MTPAEIGPRRRVLHVLSQRPELTGSGVTMGALVTEAAQRGWDQWVLCGVPAGESVPRIGELPAGRVHTVTFGRGGDVPFPVPGMSDVMPYPSTVWSRMTHPQIDRYRAVWRRRLRRVIADTQPQLIHVNHLWIVGALIKDVAPDIPTVLHCHATGLRQLELCPHLGSDVIAGNRRHDQVVALHPTAAATLSTLLDVDPGRVHVVGAGYREDLFHPRGAPDAATRAGSVVFAGKFAEAKGLPWLLDAVATLAAQGRDLTLHVVGDGSGFEAEALRERMQAMAPRVRMHGRLDQAALAGVMRACAVLALPSFYEGLPLVVIEACACGCRVVATDLPVIRQHLAPHLGDDLILVAPPTITPPDRPVAAELPRFRQALTTALAATLDRGPALADTAALAEYSWRAVFARVEAVWRRALDEDG